MTRVAKLYAHVVANPRASLSFADFERLLRAFGFNLDRQRGSHRVYEHPRALRPLIVQPRKDGKAKPYQVIELLDMVEACQLTIDDQPTVDE